MYVEEINKLILDFIISYSGVLLPSSIALTYVSASLTKKYKLIHNNKITNHKIIHESNALKTIRKKPKKPIIDKETIDIINEAVELLSHELSKETMEIIKRNLTSINKIKNKTSPKNKHDYGFYQTNSHSINIYLTQDDPRIKRQILSHELMHAAASYSYKNIMQNGFMQSIDSIETIGLALNEGYTDLLSQRYFCQNIDIFTTPYEYQKTVSAITELIIGKQKMQELYFQGNLKELIEELSKYQEKNKVKQFILDLDTILNIQNSHNKYIKIPNEKIILTQLYNRVNIFLYNAFSQKTKKEAQYLEESNHFLDLFTIIEEQTTTPKTK